MPTLSNSALTTAELRHLVERVDPEFTRFNSKISPQGVGEFSETLVGDAIAFQDAGNPKSTYYNRVVGFSEKDVSLLSEIESIYAQAGLNCVVSLPPHRQSANVLCALQRHGFHYIGSDYNFILRLGDYVVPDAVPQVEVRLVAEGSLATLFDLMRRCGANHEPDAVRFVQEHYCRKPIQFYIAYVDGIPAASASVFYFEGVAWLNNAVTEESYRGRGCHRALLQARIASAYDEGCLLAVSDTEFGSISHRNIATCGFQVGFASAELMKPFNE